MYAIAIEAETAALALSAVHKANLWFQKEEDTNKMDTRHVTNSPNYYLEYRHNNFGRENE